MKNFVLTILFLAVCMTAKAHVGSAGVQMQGQAGPYKVLVSVEPPDVIPGTAKITVYIESGNAKKVLARPIYFYSGDKGAPSPDELAQIAGQTGQFQGVVWLMEWGSSSAQIQIEGDQGKGELIVPIVAVSTAERDMPKHLGIGLSILGVLLFLLMITTIGASVSDGILKPGETLTAAQKRKRWINMGIATILCSLILYGGSSWWDSWAAEYKQWLYRPVKGSAAILQPNDKRVFQLKVDTTGWHAQRRGSMLSTLIPDHGKLMHTFLVRTPGLDAFAHIHPERKDSTTFEAFLPKLPAGKYLVYSDIVQRSGFAETIVDTIDIPEQASAGRPLPVTAEEDTYVVTDPINAPGNVPLDENVVICGKPGTKTVFKDGSYAVWEGMPNKPLDAGKPYQLTFEFFNPDGSACYPEPYLGMTGHVAVVRSDGSVYIHLHPTGTFAMAAEQTFRDRMADTARTAKAPAPAMFRDSIDRYLAKLKAMPMEEREIFLMTEMGMYDIKDGAMTGMDHGNRISFPYSFPKAGRYRIFLQLKRNAKVLTGVYDVKVKDAVTL
ncbi:hypothetical protein MUK70_28245 [Dyadobacter chenwenxiniae]|uniref:Uncharacterized protein n=1 Tax=Dyadobacter chenwenxiniae TaxID=2906456 RepID=A0A9X1PR58_9BACT|nr:hypothetical protein [Dyadobacter chenwenxiniae]MCF0064173.1 hypothetical protein [Dyadobacter chenwenxiniae]UON82900.1 hypothetical protein MUK70_28245 [Dyadobacter chenwenxiniae]